MESVAFRDRIQGELDRCIGNCIACALAATACADECLGAGGDTQVTRCFLSDLECVDFCSATASSLQRFAGANLMVTRAVVDACRIVAAACADECGQAADLDGACEACMRACRATEASCAALLLALDLELGVRVIAALEPRPVPALRFGEQATWNTTATPLAVDELYTAVNTASEFGD